MRRIIAEIALSIDGYIEGPNGQLDWLTPISSDFEETGFRHHFLSSFDTIFYGRIAYQKLGILQSFDKVPPEIFPGFNSMVNKMRKYVFSRSMKHVPGNAMVINENILSHVNRIKDEDGKDIWLCGGAGIIKSFSDLHLIDEYMLAVHPVILGCGKPLFGNIVNRLALKLMEKKKLTSGVVFLRYKP